MTTPSKIPHSHAVEAVRMKLHDVDCPHKDALSIEDIRMLSEAAITALVDMGWKMEGEYRWKNEIIGKLESMMKSHMDDGDVLSTVAVNNCIDTIRQTLPPQTGRTYGGSDG